MTRMHARVTIAAAAGAAMIAAGIAPAAAQTVAGGQSAVATYQGTAGVAHLVPRAAAAATATSHAPAGTAVRGVRLLPRTAATSSVTVGTATAAATTTKPLLANFNGVSSRDSQFTNFNQTFEPPDQGLCEGAGFVLEPVNSAYRIYRTSGKSIRGPFNVNELFNEGGKEFTSDPRCWFDPTTQTWFATILFLNDTFTSGHLDVAVRADPDPTGLWTEYQVNTDDLGGPGCPCFGDQPRIGIDQFNLYVTTDEFSINGPEFNGGQVYAFDKSDLVAGKPAPHFVHFPNLHIAGTLSGAPQPALSIGKPDAEYFLSSLDPNGNGDNRLGVWAMTHRDRVGRGGVPLLTSVVIKSEPYSIPPPAKQKGSSVTLDSGDDRMQQASFVSGTVWGSLTTGVKPAGDSTVRAGAAWFQVKPSLGKGRITGASIVRQGYVAKSGEYVMYPAVQPDAAGNAAMVFTLTGKSRFASAAYAVLKGGSSAFGPPAVAAAGTGPYDPTASRWGDYSFAVPDTTSDSAWLATEYVPPASSQTTTGARNWGTRVFKVALG